MIQKYKNTPDHKKVTLMRLSMLLQCKQVHEAKQLAEEIITGESDFVKYSYLFYCSLV